MARLSHVQESQQGELTQNVDFPQLAPEIGPDIQAAPVEKYVIFKLVNTAPKGRRHLPGTGIGTNPKTKKPDGMRCIDGAQSIWLSEQKDLSPEYVKDHQRHFVFEGKIVRLPESDTLGIEFLRNSEHFVKSKSHKTGSRFEFFEWDPAEQERAALAKEELENEVVALAMTAPYKSVKKHAAYLGINFNDEYGIPRTEQGIRTLYARAAKKDPAQFKKDMDSKEVEVAYLIREAMINSKIDLQRQQGKAFWANGGLICPIPQGRKPIEYLTELALMPNDDGKQFLERLQQQAIE